jgi:ParB/RepB/Spo0J family partition protein
MRPSNKGKSLGIRNKLALQERTIFDSNLKIQKLPIIEIIPDPNQARQLLPDPLKLKLFAGELPTVILEEFIAQQPGNNDLQKIISLAQTIQSDGLATPISVRTANQSGYSNLPEHIKYVITTGERRWWAHIYLLLTDQKIQEGVTQAEPDEIAAVPTADGTSIVAQQLLENFQREDLNAVEKAAGLQQLKKEMEQKGEKVTWVEVDNRIGIKNRYGTYLRKVLKLTPEALTFIQLHGFKEASIRPITTRLVKQPKKLQLEALKHLLKIQNPTDSDSELLPLDSFIDQLLGGAQPKTAKVRKPTVAKPINLKSFQKGVGKIADELAHIDLLSMRSENRNALAKELHRLLETVQEKLKGI